jgi:hypothetical protein
MNEDLHDKFKEWKEAEEEFARLKKGPMGTVEYSEEEIQQTNLEEGV